MELPSINSTTSIPDNQELRNYYDKLLFKNNSGKSLADLPGKMADFNDNSAAAHPRSRVDLINGYIGFREDKQSLLGQKNTKRASFSAFADEGRKQSEMSINGKSPNLSLFSFEFNGTPTQDRKSYKQDYLNVMNTSPNNILSPLNNSSQKYYPQKQQQQQQQQQQSIFDPGRRSSYISDALIHGNAATQQPQYSQPVYINNNPSLQVPYTAPSEYTQQQQYSSPFNARRNTQPVLNLHPAAAPTNDAGLAVVDGKNLTSSKELHDLYLDCGSNYFARDKVYKFIDSIKGTLCGDNVSTSSSRIIEFLDFLKNCNLNYNPQSDAFISTAVSNASSTGAAKSKNSTSMHLHYKPLVLVSLKNGKLELLSKPQTATLILKRGDLVIIDGDRGKDLVLVVEPVVDINLALFINFLKKKIHFDSLITNSQQHFPNDQFIKTLVDTTNGKPVAHELNPKLYDIIELTQLIIPSKQVLRFATPWESSTNLHNKFQDELKALHIAQLKLRSLNNNNSGGGLNIKILNAEFQFDRKKLTFYYICQERNDFRDLIKELFKFYKTRIWLCAIPNNLSIDSKFYDSNKFEWEMYQDMMSHYSMDNTGIVVAPELNRLKLDDFQIGVYMELVKVLFG
ncbi:CFC_HP_G0010250.mRNA.1.CDS.1 [Saccharomyces cerevisiae]|nr:CFC_HP_G0051420.mRNA.1.CDS.1 [Saccharomyces cerevisiae]CAI5010796.1 CFC_HP_G0010250.mRNA.1.CDS.1 [Saccharomyces cerevisiae]CAI6487938.1 CFC_HP_G0051420.mRNA.1.CDS.1 [Saccharomyces cerevisiae]CAI6927473.1 CFC_HP_G0010250.mRNA.1.CDS.1 [Saccharomyces cerevisiae]